MLVAGFLGPSKQEYIYQAAILSEMFKDIEMDYKGLVGSLKLYRAPKSKPN